MGLTPTPSFCCCFLLLLQNLLLDDFFAEAVQSCQVAWRKVVGAAAEHGIPVPAFSTALSFYDGYRCARLPANLIQAQRDYFGAHTYVAPLLFRSFDLATEQNHIPSFIAVVCEC